jgi:hypothetical protein
MQNMGNLNLISWFLLRNKEKQKKQIAPFIRCDLHRRRAFSSQAVPKLRPVRLPMTFGHQ